MVRMRETRIFSGSCRTEIVVVVALALFETEAACWPDCITG